MGTSEWCLVEALRADGSNEGRKSIEMKSTTEEKLCECKVIANSRKPDSKLLKVRSELDKK